MAENLSILLYGYGGHSKVVAECLQERGISIAGVFDDNPRLNGWSAKFPLLGPYSEEVEPHLPVLISIGNNEVRKELSGMLKHAFTIVQHPSALVSPGVSVGEGTVLLHRAVVQAGAGTGKHSIINTAAVVEHDCRLGNFVHVAPGAVLCGNVSVGEASLIGAGAVVLPGIRIGRNCKVGAGAVVCKDVPDGRTVAGNPARIIK